MAVKPMRLLASATLVVAGLILILLVDGSIGGVSVDTVGGAMVLLGLVSALVIIALGAAREVAHGHEGEEPRVLRRR